MLDPRRIRVSSYENKDANSTAIKEEKPLTGIIDRCTYFVEHKYNEN
jgi:hypothetical protein